jgi:hypothetical protein
MEHLSKMNLDLVLTARKSFPFEPLRQAFDKFFLTWKMAFLVAITSAGRASEMHALGLAPPYTAFTAMCFTLIPDMQFLPKVNTAFHTSQSLCLPALHDKSNKDLRLLCVCRVLHCYIERTRPYRHDQAGQMFVAYGQKCKGVPISKTRLSRWLVELIKWVYCQERLDVPTGMKGQQTQKSTSITDMAGVDPQLICNAATWALRCTFAKHYRLNLAIKARSDFSRQVLPVTGSVQA